MSGAIRYSEEVVDQWEKLYRAGVPLKDISMFIGGNPVYIRTRLRARGVPAVAPLTSGSFRYCERR